MVRRTVVVATGLLLNMLFAGLLFAQRSDRIIITGVVTDPAGAAVPGAKVTVTDEGTGVTSVVDTSGTGNYATPPLTLGTYTLKVEKEGFKGYVRSGIVTLGGQTYRQDAILELGAMTQTVEVRASAEMINVSSADVSHTVNERYYKDLPIVMGADIRLAEALLHVEPGYLPMQPNADTMFRGTQFNSRINGGQTMSTENYFDGAAFGFAEGHQQTQESALPYEAVRELKVINNSYSAQYGHTSGGLIEYTTKSGTNDFHGSVYEYLGNDAAHARVFFLPGKNKVRQNNPGFSLGGPIRKDKTHFFTNYDLMKMRQGIISGLTTTLPSPAFVAGDFSSVLTANSLGTDALGRTIFDGAVYDPQTTRNVTAGVLDASSGIVATSTGPVRDPFAGNIIPANHPMRSTVAAQITPFIPTPDNSLLINNTFGGSGDASAVFDITTWLLRVDHTFGPSFKSSTTFFLNNRPAIRRCGGVQLCDTDNPPGDSASNTNYIGTGFFQHIKNRFIHQQFDWIIKPNLFNHTTLSFDRWFIGGHGLNAGGDWNSRLGLQHNITTADGANIMWPLFDNGGMPGMHFGGGVIPYTEYGLSWGRGYDANNRWQFLDDITYIKGKHTIKAGFEYRYHQFPLSGWAGGGAGMGDYDFNARSTRGYDDAGNSLFNTGDAFASFLLGQVSAGRWLNPEFTQFYDRYWAPWVNDEFKVSDKLTVTFGIRFDYNQARYEKYDRYSSFSPTAPNPGAGGLPGAVLFAGTGSGRTGSRFFENPSRNAWGPRFGLTYRLSPKSVIRGGYGMYYSVLPFSQFMERPQRGFSNNPTANNTTNLLLPTFHLDTGLANTTTATLGTNPKGTTDAIGPVVTLPPFIDPNIDNNRDTIYVPSDSLTQPRYQNWSLSYQRQLQDNLLLDIAYVGNRGTQLPATWQYGGPAANMNTAAILGLGSPALLSSDISNGQTLAPILAMPIETDATSPNFGLHTPYSGFAGTIAQALRPFPQYRNVLARSLPIGRSIYHSFQLKLDKRFSSGFQYRVAYTWSRLINDGAESGQSGFGPAGNAWQGSGLQNPLDVHQGERARSLDDVPHMLILAYTYELPFGPGKKFGGQSSGVASKIIGGWSISAVQRYQSGRPLSITMDNGTFGPVLFNPSRRPNKGSGGQGDVSGGFDPATDRAILAAGFSDPGPTTPFGSTMRIDPDIRTFRWFNEDINLFKNTNVTERIVIRFEAMFGNAFNRVYFCNPNANWSSPDFGRVSAQCDVPRRIQFGLRVDF